MAQQGRASRREMGGRSARLFESDLGDEVRATFEGSRLRLRGRLGRGVRPALAGVAGSGQGSLSRRGDRNLCRQSLRLNGPARTAAAGMIRRRRSHAARPSGDRTLLSPSRRLTNHRQHPRDRHEGDQGEPEMDTKRAHRQRDSTDNDDTRRRYNLRAKAHSVKPGSRSVIHRDQIADVNLRSDADFGRKWAQYWSALRTSPPALDPRFW